MRRNLTNVGKKLIGAGAGVFLPFALSKLRYFASTLTVFPFSRTIEAEDATIILELSSASAGQITIMTADGFVGSGSVSPVNEGLGGTFPEPTYRVYGGGSRKTEFKAKPKTKFPTLNRALFGRALPKFKYSFLHVTHTSSDETDIKNTFDLCVKDGAAEAKVLGSFDSFDGARSIGAPSGSSCFMGRLPDTDGDCYIVVTSRYLGTDTPVWNDTRPRYLVYTSRTVDGGKTWSDPAPVDEAYGDGFDQVSGEIYALGDKSAIMMLGAYERNPPIIGDSVFVTPCFARTDDGGETWVTHPANFLFDWILEEDGDGTTLFSLLNVDDVFTMCVLNAQFTMLGSGNLLLTTLYTSVQNVYAFGGFDSNNMVAVYRSADNGFGWSNLAPLADEVSELVPLGTNSAAGTVVVYDRDYPNGTVDKTLRQLAVTTDGGMTWEYRALPPWTPPFQGLLPFVSLASEVPKGEDGEKDFTKTKLAIPWFQDAPAPYNGSGAYAGSLGYYVFYSDDCGVTWKRGGRIAKTTTHPLWWDTPNFLAVTALNKAGSLAFPTMYANDGEPIL